MQIEQMQITEFIILFSDGEHFVSKVVRYGDEFLRLIREAERDFAFQKHRHEYREHIKPKNFWTDPPDAEEQALIDQIVKAINADDRTSRNP